MVLEAATPAIGSIGLADFAGCDEGVVALVADVVVAVVADVTVVSGVAGRNWIVADVAVLLDRDYDVAVLWQVRKGDGAVFRCNFYRRGSWVLGANMCDLE